MTQLLIQEPDRIPGRRIVSIGIGSLVLFAIGVLLAWRLLVLRTGRIAPQGSAPIPRTLGRTRTGLVDSALFGEPSGLRMVASQKQRLSRYGWVDRTKGIAHIPIERAMDLVAEKEVK